MDGPRRPRGRREHCRPRLPGASNSVDEIFAHNGGLGGLFRCPSAAGFDARPTVTQPRCPSESGFCVWSEPSAPRGQLCRVPEDGVPVLRDCEDGVPVLRGSEDGLPRLGRGGTCLPRLGRRGPCWRVPARATTSHAGGSRFEAALSPPGPHTLRGGRAPPRKAWQRPAAPCSASLRLRCVGPATLAATGRFQATGKWGRACAFVAVCA